MTEEHTPVDISSIPELLRIVEEVRESGRPRVLQRDNKDMAVVVPMPTKGRSRSRALDQDAVLAVAGAWKDLVDAAALKEQLAAERGSDRSPAPL